MSARKTDDAECTRAPDASFPACLWSSKPNEIQYYPPAPA